MQVQVFKEIHLLQMNKRALRMSLFEVCANKKSRRSLMQSRD